MNSRNQAILQQLRGGLVVSCQALPEEPLHLSLIHILEDELDAAVQDLFLLLAQVPQVFFPAVMGTEIVHHGSIGGLDQLDDGFTQGGLSAAGFPHQAQGLAPVDVQVHVVDRLDVVGHLVEKAAAHGEKGLHTAQLQQHFLRFTHMAAASSLRPV